MKDYTSLEHRIRQIQEGRYIDGWTMVYEDLWVHKVGGVYVHFQDDGKETYYNTAGQIIEVSDQYRNDELRKKVANVGRPNTAKNPFDPKSKLAKQAEIKTKIIDEEEVDEGIAATIGGAVGGFNGMAIGAAVDHLVTKGTMYYRKKMEQRKAAKEKKEPEAKKSVKEDILDEASKKDDKDNKKATVSSKAPDRFGLTKDPDKKKVPKKESGAVDDDKDPRKLTGGKTPVDIHPTTDDSLDVDDKETKDSNKARAAENKKIGVKEDVHQFKIAAARAQQNGNKHAYHKAMHQYHAELATTAKDPQTKQRHGQKSNEHRMAMSEKFTDEELAHIEAVMAEDYVDMSKKTVDKLINAKGKPHKVYTATDETRHGMGVDELKRHLKVRDSDSVHKKFMHNLHTAGIRTGWSHSAGKWIAYHGKKV